MPPKKDGKAKGKDAGVSVDVGRQALALLRKAGTYADYETCASLFTDAIALNNSKALYYFSRGKCFLALHQYQRALFDFSMALRLESGNA